MNAGDSQVATFGDRTQTLEMLKSESNRNAPVGTSRFALMERPVLEGVWARGRAPPSDSCLIVMGSFRRRVGKGKGPTIRFLSHSYGE